MKKEWYFVLVGLVMAGIAGLVSWQPKVEVPVRTPDGTFTYHCATGVAPDVAQTAHEAYTQQLKALAKEHGTLIANVLKSASSPDGSAVIEEAGAQYYAEADQLRKTIQSSFGCLPPLRQD